MCGRIVLSSPPEQLALPFDAELDPDVDPCGCNGYNVPPTSPVLAVAATPVAGALRRSLGWYRWGMGQPGQAPLFNARAETVASKPSFRTAFASRRVLVVVDGFYEWERGPGGHRQPHYFHRADGRPLALAGLWERGPGPAGTVGEPGTSGPATGLASVGASGPQPSRSCAVVTTAANADMGGVHDRMPVVLEPGAFDAWLDPGNHDRDELEALLTASPEGTLVHHAVSTRVGDVRNDDPSLLERVEVVAPVTLFG